MCVCVFMCLDMHLSICMCPCEMCDSFLDSLLTKEDHAFSLKVNQREIITFSCCKVPRDHIVQHLHFTDEITEAQRLNDEAAIIEYNLNGPVSLKIAHSLVCNDPHPLLPGLKFSSVLRCLASKVLISINQ